VRLVVVSLLQILCIVSAFAKAQPVYPFHDKYQSQQFRRVLSQLRCLVCQNESLAFSNAPLAQDMRRVIYRRIKKGDSNQAIIHFMTQRYGDFVRLKPPMQNNTYLLWLGPFILFAIAVVILVIVLAKRHR